MSQPPVPKGSACPYLGRADDPDTIHLHPHAEHCCYVTGSAVRIDVDQQVRHCFDEHETCPRWPVTDLNAPAAARAQAEAEAEAARAERRPLRPAMAEPPAAPRAQADRAALPWWRRWGFERWTVTLVTLALAAAIGWTLFQGGTGLGDGLPTPQPAYATALAALEPTATPTPLATYTPRPTRVSSPAPTPLRPTPPAGGLSAALSPSERGVGTFAAYERLPEFGARGLEVGWFGTEERIAGLLMPLGRVPEGSELTWAALELAGHSAASLGGEGRWTVEMLDAEAAAGWSDLTYSTLRDAEAVPGASWTLDADDLAPRKINLLELSDEALASLSDMRDEGRVAFRIVGPPNPDGSDNLFAWDSGYGEGFGTRPTLRVSFVPPPPTPTPDRDPDEPTPLPLVVWIGEPTPAPTSTPLPGEAPDELRGGLLFLSDRFGRQPTLMVYDQANNRIGQVTQPWPYEVASRAETRVGDLSVSVKEVPCGSGEATIRDEDGDSIPNPDPARRCNQILVARDGGEPREVTQNGSTHYDPALSPDGEWIVYVSQMAGNDEIFKMRVDGSENTRLTENDWAWDKHPSFSPDGSRIVFWTNREGPRRLYIMDADGGDERPFLPSKWEDWDPVWVK